MFAEKGLIGDLSLQGSKISRIKSSALDRRPGAPGASAPRIANGLMRQRFLSARRNLVERKGIEPSTFALRTRRSPN